MVLRLHFLDYGKDLNVPTESEIPEEDIEEEMPSLQDKNSSSRPSEESHPGLDHLFMTRETSTLTDITFEDVDADMWEHVAQDRTGINLKPSTSNVNADESAEKDDQEEEGGHEDQEDHQEEEEEEQEKEVPKQSKRKKEKKGKKTSKHAKKRKHNEKEVGNTVKENQREKRDKRRSTTQKKMQSYKKHYTAVDCPICHLPQTQLSRHIIKMHCERNQHLPICRVILLVAMAKHREQSRGTRRLGGQGETTKVYRGRPKRICPLCDRVEPPTNKVNDDVEDPPTDEADEEEIRRASRSCGASLTILKNRMLMKMKTKRKMFCWTKTQNMRNTKPGWPFTGKPSPPRN